MQENKPELSRPAAASVSYILTAGIGKLAALLTLPFFTAHLGAAAFGRYALYLCYEGLLFAAAALGLGGAAVYRALQRYRGEENRLLSAALGLSLTVSLPLFFIAAFFLKSKLTPLLIALLFAQVTARIAFTLFGAKCRYLYRYRPICALNLIADIGAPLVGILLLSLFAIEERARIYAGAFVSIVLAAISLFSILKRGTRLFDREIWRYLLSLQLPLLPHYLSVAFMAEAARLSVERLLGSEALGAYSIAHSVGLALSILTVSIGGAFQPWILRKTAAGEHGRVAAAAEKLTLLLCTLSLLVILFAPELFSLLATEAYNAGLYAVPALCFTVPLSFLATVPICASLSAGRRGRISLCSLASALVQLLLCPALAVRFGLGGAAFGAFFSYLSFFLLHSVFLKKEQKGILNVKNCFLICISFALVGAMIPFLFPHFWLRIILAVLYLIATAAQALPLKSLILETKATSSAPRSAS